MAGNQTLGVLVQTMKLSTLVILLSLASGGNAATRPRITDYCLNDQIEAQAGKGESFPLGEFIMKARLVITGSHYVLDAWNVMPDNSQTLEIHADGTYHRSGPTPIRFIDNFNNRGRGSFIATKSTFHIDIDRVKASPEGLNIGRNYGSFDLESHRCKWDQQ
jgi:hypothetical protein